MQKLLEQVDVKIGSVLTDVFGVSGLHMLLSAKRKTLQLIEAIEGNRMSDHVRFLIRGCLRHLACLEEEVEELDTEILRRMQLSTFQKSLHTVTNHSRSRPTFGSPSVWKGIVGYGPPAIGPAPATVVEACAARDRQ